MRLSTHKAAYIKSELKFIDPASEVYLFGSRVDDHARGGDIDILWLTGDKISQKDIRKFRIGFYKKFGWQKIDIVNFTFQQQDTFKEIASGNAMEL